MEFKEVPTGFGMALAQNEAATNAYAMMTEEQKNDILKKATKARTRRQMEKLVSQIAKENAME